MADSSGRNSTLLLFGGIAASSVLAGAVLLRGGPRASVAHARFFDQRGPQLRDPAMLGEPPDSRSSYDLLRKTPEMAQGDSPPQAAGGDATRAPSPPGPETAGSTPAAGLTASEKAQLMGLAGDITDPQKAVALGAGSDGLWMTVMRALARHPRILSYVLNNNMVVKAFMGRPENERYCQNAGAFKNYLMDLKSPTGITHDMGVFGAVVHGDPKTPGAVFGSKLADAMLSCPSGQTLLHDQKSITEIAQANPALVQMTLDPTVMLGIASNQAVSATMQRVQASMSPAPQGR